MEQLRLFTPPEPEGRRNQRGAELVEFALVFPVLMLFVIASLSVLWLGFMKVAAAQSAKEAARFASVPISCEGDIGSPLVQLPSTVTVPNTFPDGSPIPQAPDPLKTIDTVSKTVGEISQTQPPAPPNPGDVNPPQAMGHEVKVPMQLASASHQLPPIPTLPPTTLPTLPATTLPTLPATTLPTLPATTLPTLPATTLPTLPATTLPPTTLPLTTTSTVPGKCTNNFRTYPEPLTVMGRVNHRIPASLWSFAPGDFDIVYTYNDPACPSGEHTPPDNATKRCPTPANNNPPSNSKVAVKLTKDIKGPLGAFTGIFGVHEITANSGGETRAE